MDLKLDILKGVKYLIRSKKDLSIVDIYVKKDTLPVAYNRLLAWGAVLDFDGLRSYKWSTKIYGSDLFPNVIFRFRCDFSDLLISSDGLATWF